MLSNSSGDLVGIEVAELLAERGKTVTVVGDAEKLDQVQGAVRSAWDVARHL